MNRPWPVTLLSAFYAVSCVAQVWSSVYTHHWARLAWLPLYIALCAGLWLMRRWGLILALVFNGLVGGLVTALSLWQFVWMIWKMIALKNFSYIASHFLPHILVMLVVAAVFCWWPFFYLRQPKVRQLFS
jgi:hypothetical protein